VDVGCCHFHNHSDSARVCSRSSCRSTKHDGFPTIGVRHCHPVTSATVTPLATMAFLPDRARFQELAQTHRYIPVYRRLLSDSLTPLSAFARLDTGSCGCLFESVIGGERVGRWSFLAAEPFLQFDASGHQVHLRGHTAEGEVIDERFECDDPFAELQRRMEPFRPARLSELPPFTSGVVGFVSYDAVRYVEHLPDMPPDDLQLPDLSFAFYDRMVVFDNVNKTLDVVVLAHVRDTSPEGLASAYDDACRRCDATVSVLSAAGEWPQPADIDPTRGRAAESTSSMTNEQYVAAVQRAIEFIHAGDIFQVVLSQRFETDFALPPLELYRTLRVVNPSPFMFHLRTPDVTLVGSSPEIMVRVVDNTVTVRPLAGTRPRGRTPEEDRQLAESLLADPKERAEHVMLIDLGRNDVGRVAELGSVELSDVMCIERYSHVMHLTSNVTGQLSRGHNAFDALRACLPAGTVSGAPKIRAMEIIDELEPIRRGPYAGAVGYIDFSGAMDTCITLRTVVLKDGKAFVQAGAGIVADSIPQREYEETVNKARGLLVAIELTRQRLAAQPSRSVPHDSAE
jgi:anthranilate synthase component 1